mmetsp:Transcript_14115/g.20155  ORF Transcript_14115/g.20155 Transcript_14115/m.20155 type:complete len:229 (-) Transcript_14115:31-717(-)
MFSANQNIVLRQHKRRIIEYVESTIPETVLDSGTTVLAMEVACNQPGCVPLETSIVVVFPRSTHSESELIPGIKESGGGGSGKRGNNFKTRILKPMAMVTKEDVLDALPPQFNGGRKTMERLRSRVLDVVLGQINQTMGSEEEDFNDRKDLAEYLIKSLKNYIENGCVHLDNRNDLDNEGGGHVKSDLVEKITYVNIGKGVNLGDSEDRDKAKENTYQNINLFVNSNK